MRPSFRLIAGLAIAASFELSAADLSGSKTITLVSQDGKALAIGQIELSPNDKGYAFRVSLNETPFGTYFLAMRPFKCIAGEVQHLCHFAYKVSGQVTPEDFTELEYALLFLHKKPNEVSVDPWNGVYYRLTSAGNRLEGTLYEVDLNLVTAPQQQTDRPIRREHLHQADPGSHRFPRLVIE